MSCKVEQGEKNQVILEIQVSVEEMDAAIQKASVKIAKKVNIPGFRKGKVPQHILENFVGVPAIMEEAAEMVVSPAYAKALDEVDIEPVDSPSVEITELEKGKPMVFKATVTVKPQVTLGQYKGLDITKKIKNIDAKAVEAEVDKMRTRVAKLIDLGEDAIAENECLATIDFEGFKDGVPFDGGMATNYSLQLGSNTFIPGFEEQVVGMKIGEEKDVNVTFPESYQEESLAGQPVVFKVKLNGLRKKQLPDLTPEFVKEISETADDIEQLRAELKAKLSDEAAKNAEQDMQTELLNKAAENIVADIPPVMISHRVDSMVDEFSQSLQQQGLQLEMYLQFTQMTIEQMKEQYREQAEKAVKIDLLLEEIVKAENIECSDEDLDKQIADVAASYKQPGDKLRKALEETNRLDSVRYGIKMMKAGEVIYDSAVVSEEVIIDEEVVGE